MKPSYRFSILAIVLSTFAGCNSGNGPDKVTTTSTTTTSVAPMAVIDVELVSFGAAGSGQGNLFGVEIDLKESGGVGANINFARLEVFRATGELEERQEIGSDDIIQGVGDNRLEANTTEHAFIYFGFRATIKKGRTLDFTMGFTDDFGHDIPVVNSFVFN